MKKNNIISSPYKIYRTVYEVFYIIKLDEQNKIETPAVVSHYKRKEDYKVVRQAFKF